MPRGYSDRVIREYKGFCYLAVVAGRALTPSDAVDQAWHLHMLYSRSYWHDFCDRLLGSTLEHAPTEGGDDEVRKLKSFMEKY